MKFLIVGLGNPGKEYENTRHNIGFEVLDLLGEKYSQQFKLQKKIRGELIVAGDSDRPVLLLKPTTYMNLSGESIRSAMKFYGVETEGLLVVVDDVELPLGFTRMRIQSSSGGHNGLKSVESALQSREYARLRLGVGKKSEDMDLSEHVLGRFSQQERVSVSAMLLKAVATVELFINDGLTRAMNFANQNI
jgi:PTH1 family peptidyl-tRNA hydrolase